MLINNCVCDYTRGRHGLQWFAFDDDHPPIQSAFNPNFLFSFVLPYLCAIKCTTKNRLAVYEFGCPIFHNIIAIRSIGDHCHSLDDEIHNITTIILEFLHRKSVLLIHSLVVGEKRIVCWRGWKSPDSYTTSLTQTEHQGFSVEFEKEILLFSENA
jgi:hypothetical protein